MTAGRHPSDRDERREGVRTRWERATRWPLIALSIGFLVAYSMLAITSDRPRDEQITILIIMGIAWLAFIIDPIVRITLTAPAKRRSFFAKHRVDFFSAILPILRPFTLLRHLDAAPGFGGNGGNALRSRVIATAAAYAGMFVYVIAITVLRVERGAEGATILSFGEAIWWAFVTIATVGYGDYVPVTGLGRFLAVILMAGGVVIIGTSSALIVSYLSERIGHKPPVELREPPVPPRPDDAP
jgi:voltage-gated potassium channel